MKQYIANRVIAIADYIISTHCTVREAGKVFSQSKSTVHKDMQQRLLLLDGNRYNAVYKIMENHLDTRHIRGGIATQRKYNRTVIK